MLDIFGHAGETEDNVIEAVQHYAEVSPVISVMLGIIFIATIVSLAYMLSKNSLEVAIWTLLLLLLLAGLLLYAVMPIVSIGAIILGFILSLGIVFGGLR